MSRKAFVNIITPKGQIMANYKKWTETELNFIKDNHTYCSDEELAAKLSQITNQNITIPMVRRQRRKLKLDKQKGRPKKFKKIDNIVSELTAETIN